MSNTYILEEAQQGSPPKIPLNMLAIDTHFISLS